MPNNNQRCFSRSGWWQTLCGLDAANQGFGWSDKVKYVGCENCKKLIKRNCHWLAFRSLDQILVEREPTAGAPIPADVQGKPEETKP